MKNVIKNTRVKIKRLLFKNLIKRNISRMLEKHLWELNTKENRQRMCNGVEKCLADYFIKTDVVDNSPVELIDKGGMIICAKDKTDDICYTVTLNNKLDGTNI
jgi:hypothetical protein